LGQERIIFQARNFIFDIKLKKQNKMDQITVEALHQLVREHPGLHVLDVREANEYEEYNIGARFFPLSRLRQMDAAEIEDWKDDEIIVHCRSGQRSMEACMLLQTLGFAQPVNLTGGIVAWTKAYGDERIK
jgi:rhodanese-related sulfurtransferase